MSFSLCTIQIGDNLDVSRLHTAGLAKEVGI